LREGAPAEPPPESLLSARDVAEVLARIGPEEAPEVFRLLATSSEAEERFRAAGHLARCRPPARATNLAVLRHLLGDAEAKVRLEAAVSLVLLDQPEAWPPLLAALRPGDKALTFVLQALDRVSDGKKLLPARAALEEVVRSVSGSSVQETARELLRRIHPPKENE
jgi:HEAT repeat protein